MAAIAQRRKRHWVENLTWVMIYGGLLALALGIAVANAGTALGWLVGLGGGVAAVSGFSLIIVRARMKDTE